MIAILLAAGLIPRDEPLVDRVDVCEVNHVCDARGRCTFSQLIWWDLDAAGEYHVVDWRMLGKSAWPQRRGDQYVSSWWDAKTCRRRQVSAPAYRETITRYDPEVRDRETVPCERRRGLRSASGRP